MNNELFAQQVEMLLREAIEASDSWTEDDYGRAIMHCCGAEFFELGTNHEQDCWMIKAKKLLGV